MLRIYHRHIYCPVFILLLKLTVAVLRLSLRPARAHGILFPEIPKVWM